MKRILGAALMLQLLFTVSVQAQFQNIESRYLGQIRSKTLLVAEVEEMTSTLRDLQKDPEGLSRYKNGIVNFNLTLKNAVEKYGKFAKAVEFLPQNKVNAILREGNTKYLVLQYRLREGQFKPLMFSEMYADNEYTSDRRKISEAEGFGVFQLLIPVKGKDPEEIYSVFVPVAYPSPGDMIYAMQMMTNQVHTMQKQRTYQVNEFEAEIGKNNKGLNNRTLLIDPSQLDGKTEIAELTKKYTNPMRVVDYSEINRAIMENDSSVAYVQIVPMEMPNEKVGYGKAKTQTMHLVVNAGSSQVMAKSRVTRMDYDVLANDISKKEIEDYLIKVEAEKQQPTKGQPTKGQPTKGQPAKQTPKKK